MKTYKNDDGNRIVEFSKDLCLMIRKEPNRKFIFWNAPGMKKFCGLKYNTRCKIGKKVANWCRFWVMDFPGFHWNADNSGWRFGTQKVYLWSTKWRAPLSREEMEF